MEGEERDPGYDDWFDEPEPPTEPRTRSTRDVYEDTEEVWVLPEEEESDGGRRDIVIAGRTLTTTQAVIIGVSIVALIIAILAAVGVFSGSKAPVPPVTTTPPPPPQTQTTTTQTATTPTVQAPSQTLSPGATGPQVKDLQRSLNALNYSVGTVDGFYGPATKTAVEQFQAANGLAQDGVVGPETLAKIQQKLSG